MTASGVNSTSPLGFLTVVEDTNSGLFGGYLVLNRSGRPLEFHCTAPIRPNRAQEILYGPTLKPYLYGEQIGRTLLEKGKQTPAVVLTDCEPMLAVAEFVTLPVVLVGAEKAEGHLPADCSPKDAGGLKWRIDSAQKLEPNLRFFRVGGHCLALRTGAAPEEENSAVQAIDGASVGLDLREPFERIRAAIDEARRGGQ
ncbi:MAG: hypothetical protein GXX96_25800 [Planctomycetaceae bacterium]|jgi:hypothetical protein|nr:hypothetical protein [Planctomycetaceae bacterium]